MAKRIKAHEWWMRDNKWLYETEYDAHYYAGFAQNTVKLVAVLDISDPDTLVKQVAQALFITDGWRKAQWKSIPDALREPFYAQARAVLADMGVLPGRRAK